MRYRLKVQELHYNEDSERMTVVLPNGRKVDAFVPHIGMSPAMEQAKILETK